MIVGRALARSVDVVVLTNGSESDPPSRSEFTRRVLAAVRAIPRGRVSTYGDVAAAAGRPRAARAVGTIMATCGTPGVPCHRVVGANGALGGFSGHESEKARLLEAEGLVVVGRRIRGFATHRWR